MKKFYLIFILAIFCANSFAQIELVKDLYIGTEGGVPANLYVFDNQIYFKATDGTAGIELWKSDGTEEGTVLVKDIKSGTSGSSPSFFFELNNTLFFAAKESSGNELWKTDGTEDGTVKALPGVNIFNPVILDNLVYFTNTADGNKLYQFDGTSATAVANLGTGTEAVAGGIFTAIDGKLVLYMDYSEDEPTIGRELYQYDPATDLFTLLKDVTGDASDAGISNMKTYGSEVYFEAGNTVWVYKTADGTTAEVASIAAESFTMVNNFYAWNDYLFFEGDNGTGDQLWAYNITEGTVANLSNLTGSNTNHDPSDYCAHNGYVYYRGEDTNDTDGHLFRTNGTAIEQLDETIIDIDDIVYFNGLLFFEGEESGITGNELFSYDLRKTAEFTITDGTNPIEGVTVTLTGYDAVTTDASGVATINDIIQEDNISFTITHTNYFEYSSTISVADVNVSESVVLEKIITGNLELVKDIYIGTEGSVPANLYVFDNQIYFKATDGTAGIELWKSDGTEEGTVLVKDIKSGTSGSSPSFFFELNNTLFFAAKESSGNELWKTDGTEAGTVKALPGVNIFNPVILDNLVYFANTADGNKLYQFDGTSATAVANLGTGTEAVAGGIFTAIDGKLLLYMDYSEDEATVGRELYEYDPSTDLFTLIKDVDNGTGDASISNFTELGSKVYFEADNYLWVTDGTTGGTEAVTAAATIGFVKEFYAWNDKLYFEGDDGTGDQLWVYDPAGGTVAKLSDISGSNTNHDPVHFVAYGDYIYYAGKDEFDTKYHLYKTDGATIEVVDNNTIDIDDIVLMNNTLYFEGEVDNGNELYKLYIGGYYDVTFTVTDGTNPVEGATVTLTGYDAAITNASGIATISNVTIATDLAYTVTFDGYDSHNGTVTILDQNVSENVALNLATYDVTFTVTDGTNVLQGATVTLTGYDAVTTDVNGIATVSDVAPANDIAYTVTLIAYDDANGTVTVVDGNADENVTLTLSTYDVTFNVTDGTLALQGATVTLTGYNAVTSDANGVATVSEVAPAADIAYTVSLTDYDDVSGTVTVTDDNVNENITMQIQTGIEDLTQKFAKVYPIPTNGKITIETEEMNASYTIYDVCGKVVEKMTITETLTKVDLSAYNKGIYLIEITSENKRNIQRIILQ